MRFLHVIAVALPALAGALALFPVHAEPPADGQAAAPSGPDAKREDAKRQSYVSSTFSTGLKLADRNFVFGTRYEAVNTLLDNPFSITAYDRLPRAAEYDPDDIRYFFVRVSALLVLQYALWNLAQGYKCVDDKSYIVFFFKDGKFFRMSLRLHHGPQCDEYKWVQEALFSPNQSRLSLTEGGDEVRLFYHEDTRFTYLEIFRSGVARDDDGLFEGLPSSR